MRLFISINFNDVTTEKIQKVQYELMNYSRGNYSTRSNLHLTLSFLGEIEDNRLPDIKNALDSLQFQPFTICFSEMGCFRRTEELWWLGIRRNEALLALHMQLAEALKAHGFQPESKRFVPHITLARRTHISDEDGKSALDKRFTTKVNEVCLMLSSRPCGKLTYTKLYSVKAKD